MGPIATRRLLRRWRRHLAGVLVALSLGGAVAAHHGAVPMAPMDGHDSMALVMPVCLGAFVALGAAIVAVAIGSLRLGRWRISAPLAVNFERPFAALVVPRSRAGPGELSLFCVWRR